MIINVKRLLRCIEHHIQTDRGSKRKLLTFKGKSEENIGKIATENTKYM